MATNAWDFPFSSYELISRKTPRLCMVKPIRFWTSVPFFVGFLEL